MRLFISVLYLICSGSLCAQKTNRFVKFGSVTPQDLQTKVYSIDSSAHSVILSDVGSYTIKGNNHGFYSLIFKRHKLIHILHNSAYDLANVTIPLYVDGKFEESVEKLRAVTYNLENGKVVQSKLEKHNVFNERVDKKKTIKKFTLPQVKEGSILEYEYEIKSDFIDRPDPWFFQSQTSPELWSEFSFSVPEFFSYNLITSGYQPMFLSERKNKTDDFSFNDSESAGTSVRRYHVVAGVTELRWAMK